MAKNTNHAKGLTGKKWSKKVLARVAKKARETSPLALNAMLGMPHNVIFTRDSFKATSNRIFVWDTSGQVRKQLGGCYYQLKRQWDHSHISILSVKSFKALFGFTLPKGKAMNGRISLCGGLRTR
jgi:hypothetical protein